jgi:hypothetical protein
MACVVRQCCDACLTLLVRLPYYLEYGMELLTFLFKQACLDGACRHPLDRTSPVLRTAWDVYFVYSSKSTRMILLEISP